MFLSDANNRKMLNDHPAALIGLIIGLAIGGLLLALFVKLGMWAADSGRRIIAWTITVLLGLNIVSSLLVAVVQATMGDKLIPPPGSTPETSYKLEKDGSVSTNTTPAQPNAPPAPAATSAATPAPALASNLSSVQPRPTQPITTQPITTTDAPAASAFAAKLSDGRGMFNRIADEAAPELRALAKAFAQPPQPDRKAIEDRKAMALAVQANTGKLRTDIQSIASTITKKSADSGLTPEQTATLTKAFNTTMDIPRRTIAADEMHEITVLAIRECDLLLANLGTWRIENNRIVGKDEAHTTKLNDPRFFLRAKLNQLETRIVQLRGG